MKGVVISFALILLIAGCAVTPTPNNDNPGRNIGINKHYKA